jgi:tRNA (guanine-N7-)-methyltransferase
MRTIRSFVKRAGRMGGGQERAMAELGPKFLLPYQTSAIDFEALFAMAAGERAQNDAKNSAPEATAAPGPVVLEIGFGMGEATAHIAGVMPQTQFLCCEVHEPGVGALLKRIGEQEIENIRILQHDAVEVIDNMLPEASIDGVHIFFPDPWHKKKHNKRRLIQSPLIAKLAARIKPGGYIHCATDWEPYAVQILEVLNAEPMLQNTAENYAEKPDYRPLTKFENRGIRLGHGVWDLVFRKK